MAATDNIHNDIDKLLTRGGPTAPEGFQPCTELRDFLPSIKILLIGAGGLGCEMLKDLALMGFRDITVIDMDIIDLSNLNRQFLFREADVGESKADTAAAFINKRIPGCNVTAHVCAIQDKEESWYRQFPIIVCGLDNIEARRWINMLMCDFVELGEDGNPVPPTEDSPPRPMVMIDGGTEAFKGQTMTIIPYQNACFECRLWMFPPPTTFPACTLKTNPRIPEHCIIYVKEKIWGEQRKDKLDKDEPDHVNWIMEKSIERCQEYKIDTTKVTFQFTQGVIKNTIPAVASTNAVISAGCAVEVFKAATMCCKSMDAHSTFIGDETVAIQMPAVERDPKCYACGAGAKMMKVSKSMTLNQLLEKVTADLAPPPDASEEDPKPFELEKVSVSTVHHEGEKKGTNRILYIKSFEHTVPNLEKPLSELVPHHWRISITAKNLSIPFFRTTINFTD